MAQPHSLASGPREESVPDQEIVQILSRSLPGETIAMAYDRREIELRVCLSRLDPVECRKLRRRIELGGSDPIAEAFARLIPERRQRLLAFLADARRRDAIRAARVTTTGGARE